MTILWFIGGKGSERLANLLVNPLAFGARLRVIKKLSHVHIFSEFIKFSIKELKNYSLLSASSDCGGTKSEQVSHNAFATPEAL